MHPIEQYLVVNDKRVTVFHCSLYMALVYYWLINGRVSPFRVTRKELMRLSHIGSIPTYHKCIKELIAFGYIEYLPSYNKFVASKVWMRLITI